MLAVAPKRSREATMARGSSSCCTFGSSASICRAYSRVSFGRMRMPGGTCSSPDGEELALLAIVDGAMPQQDQRPDHEDDAHLGLVLVDHDIDRALGHVVGLDTHARVLLRENAVAAWPDVNHVERMHQDRGDDQREGAEQELALLLAALMAARARPSLQMSIGNVALLSADDFWVGMKRFGACDSSTAPALSPDASSAPAGFALSVGEVFAAWAGGVLPAVVAAGVPACVAGFAGVSVFFAAGWVAAGWAGAGGVVGLEVSCDIRTPIGASARSAALTSTAVRRLVLGSAPAFRAIVVHSAYLAIRNPMCCALPSACSRQARRSSATLALRQLEPRTTCWVPLSGPSGSVLTGISSGYTV